MSLPDPTPARKPRRLGLYIPFGLLLALIVLWSAAWVWARGAALKQMDASVAELNRAGFDIAWKERDFGGYPFRMDLTLTEAQIREPSGWALTAPKLEAEAYLYTPGHWLLAAPAGLTFVRPEKGPVTVTGKLIHASLTHLGQWPPSFSFEGVGLAFQPGPGAQPFSLSTADKVEFHLRAGPDDEGGVFTHVDNGKARLSGLFARIAGDKPISIVWNATLTKMSAFHGKDWPSAVRKWVAAGGQMRLRQAGVTAGDALIGSNSGTLTVGADGRVRGVLDVTLRQAPRALGALGDQGVIPRESARAAAEVAETRQDSEGAAKATLNFEAGQATLGPVAIAPAPKVYDPH